MAIEDKIQSSIPFMKRVFSIEDIKFDSLSQNGFFLTFGGQKILEFNTAQEASDNSLALNQLISPKIVSLRTSTRQQINDILNA